jgi:hypothetical protein
MKNSRYLFLFAFLTSTLCHVAQSQTSPEKIKFVRQGVKRLIFDQKQSIHLAGIEPGKIIGLSAMHPIRHYTDDHSKVFVSEDKLLIQSAKESQTSIWFGGFNSFATYSIDLASCSGKGEIGFEFSDANKKEQCFIKLEYKDSILTEVKLRVVKNAKEIIDKSIAVNLDEVKNIKGRIILQMLGSGFTLYLQDQGLPKVIGQSDFNTYIDLREKKYLHSFQSQLFVHLKGGQVQIKKVEMAITTGIGLADIRTITYENGDPMLDQGRFWYTMSIRGRALDHHIQGVFSMDPTVFDVKLEGIILFDRNDGILRNEVASHLFYDRKNKVWRGLTTGFSAFANPSQEQKQLLAIESKKDPRFGFSTMAAVPIDMVGDIEDPHILFDSTAHKWRMLTCENLNGYKAVVLESDDWNKGYKKIAGPVAHNSTGTSIQKIGNQLFCFSGSSDRKIYIYRYPGLQEVGSLQMDLPPWDETSGTRVWPNVVQLPEGYPFRYMALMMDRFNYPGLKGPNWTYGAIYLYHGYD